MPWAGNIAKTMTTNGKQFTVTREMLTAVAGISARYSKFAFVLFCYITNHLMTGPLGNSEFCFPRISMFPETFVSGNIGCLPFTWRNRLVDGLCKWKAKFPYWKFPFGVACTIWTTDPTYRKSLGRLWHLQNGGWNRCIQRDHRCFNWRVITSRSFSIMRKMENST